MGTLAELTEKFRSVWPLLDERTRRLMAASEAIVLGHGGVSLVRRACGLSRKAISKGIGEIDAGAAAVEGRIRRPGAGRKSMTVSDPRLVDTLEELIEYQTRGDPESPLRWICKSTRAIAKELARMKHPVSHTKVAQILHDLDYSLQSNRKTEEGRDHPDRDAQFRHINAAVKRCLAHGSPVISVDTKKKELLGNYANAGQQWRPTKEPIMVRGHDFPTPDVPRAYPYGIYDIGRNTGFVNVGTDHDTGAFAVASIRGWWRHAGDGSIGMRERFSSRPMVGGATAGGCGCGSLSYRSSRMTRACPSRCVISHQAPANGTRSNIVSFPSSPQIGGESPCATTKRSYTSSPRPPRPRG